MKLVSSGTPFLFYGPGAFAAAVDLAASQGDPLEPVGREGLKVQDSRDLVQIALEGVIGDRPPSVVVGPMDEASPAAADALLKTLEEVSGVRSLCIVLWCRGLHSVIPTIISRCNTVWSPGQHTVDDAEESLHVDALGFLELYAEGKNAEAIGLLLTHSKVWSRFLDILVGVMAQEISNLSADPTDEAKEKALKVLSLWERARPLLSPSAARSGVSLAVSQLFGHTLL